MHQNPRKRLGLRTQICVIILAMYWGSGERRPAGENRNQTIKCRTNAAQKSKNQIPLVIPPYHTTPKKNQNNQNTGSIPGNASHCVPRRTVSLSLTPVPSSSHITYMYIVHYPYQRPIHLVYQKRSDLLVRYTPSPLLHLSLRLPSASQDTPLYNLGQRRCPGTSTLP